MLTYEQSLPTEKSERGNSGMAVFVQDQTTPLLDLPFLRAVSQTTLAADTVADTRVITVSPGHSFAVGNILEIANGDNRFYQGTILSISVNDITLDVLMNKVYTSGTAVYESSDNMLVDGSVTPQIFSILPLAGQAGDIVRMIVSITSTSAQDFETFGSAPELTNGCLVRVKRSDGTFDNVFDWKSNGQLIERTFDHTYEINNGGGIRSFLARRTFGGQSKNGVVIRLDGSLGEELQIVVQDDLTGTSNQSFRNVRTRA